MPAVAHLTRAGDVFQADVMRTIIDTVEFSIEHDGDDPFRAARDVAVLHFGEPVVFQPAYQDIDPLSVSASVSDVVANLRRRTLADDGWVHVEGSFG